MDVICQHRDRYTVRALSAGGGNVELLADQALRLNVETVAIAQPEKEQPFRDALKQIGAEGGPEMQEQAEAIDVLAGPDASSLVAAMGADVVLNSITGSIGLKATLAALNAGSTLALANKESLVTGGPLVKSAIQHPGQVVPVDSEHSAMAQAMRSGKREEVRRLILTASGGPFRGKTRDELRDVTAEDALKHPTWAMGPVVTVNSATLMNKALELIEAHLLFDMPVEDIEVVVHPQSIVHSMVEFHDGSTIAQASPPDMRLPIALGLSWPHRLNPVSAPCDWTTGSQWSFEPVDHDVFPALNLAKQALAAGPLHPAVLNAANEEAVQEFLAGNIRFLEIVATVEKVLEKYTGESGDVNITDVERAEAWARATAHTVMGV